MFFSQNENNIAFDKSWFNNLSINHFIQKWNLCQISNADSLKSFQIWYMTNHGGGREPRCRNENAWKQKIAQIWLGAPGWDHVKSISWSFLSEPPDTPDQFDLIHVFE